MSNWITPKHSLGVRVRLSPDLRADNIIGVLPYGAQAEAQRESPSWWRVRLEGALRAGGAQLMPSARAAFGYVFADAVVVVQQQQPQPQRIGIGLHLLNPQASDAGRVAREALRAGMRHFTVIDDTDFARALADELAAQGFAFGRDAGIVFRWWTANNPYSPRQFADYFGGTSLMITERGARRLHPLVAFVGQNEGDVYGCWSAADLRGRAWFERELAQRVVNDLGGRYAMISFAPGNPDVSSDTARVWQDHYLPWIADLAPMGRLLIDYHSYYPREAHLRRLVQSRDYAADLHTPWHTRRWTHFYAWGTPTTVKLICSEAGLDEPGRGGFNTGALDLVRGWAEYFRAVMAQPLPDGRESPALFGTVFCIADERWRGYDVRSAWRELL